MDLLDGLAFRLFGKAIARRFVVFGGVSAVLARGSVLKAKGVTPTYNRIDEHVEDRERIEQILASYIEVVQKMDATNAGHVAIKPSAFGMMLDQFLFARNLTRVVDAGKGKCFEIEIDAEDREMLFSVQQVLNSLVPKLPDGIIFRPAFQMHLPDSVRQELITRYRILDMPLRIVKGSGLYNLGSEEQNSVEVLDRYKETFRSQIAKGIHPNVATVRDRKLVKAIKAIATEAGVYRHQYTIQFLDGLFGRSLERQCVADGYRVGRYITFVDPSAPDEWKKYVERRIAFGRKLVFGS